MANQQIRVNLMFDANVSAAKNNIQQLATLLQQIATPKIVAVNGGAIQQAAQAAQSLQMHLQNAMNVNTGKLDLTKLNFSLKQAGLSLKDLSAKLVASGTQGQQAFTKLANAIAQAGAPAAQLNATVAQFLKTMGSAMMWSAAYGALEGVTGTIREAVDYAKDLNKALNDIAIVSDLSASQLDDFAVKAAKAAKTLNTTTTEYAKAALIFYQQGLSGKEVEERANVVTKLAQVTGESAQEVSDQLTAIWNNFDDGSKSLEYYADALTALGAATAASTDEITQGLEKFAAVSETVGLSYEYATAALATVVDKTRQSADVVGTAFKTLFARIGDLELGETLDDGVTLGKYSEALNAVGVNILTHNGELKDMDNILDELGSKWDNISKAQQTALAQTVAGTRQYTQFIAIMDNYKDFKLNVDIASGAEGTLTEQWKTWADSYEAAAKRVEQRKNELYEALLDDDFVIGITDAFAGWIGSIGEAAEAMGGLGPIILTIVGLFANKLVPIVSNAATRFVQNWRVMSGAAQRESLATKESIRQLTQEMIQKDLITGSQAEALELTNQLSLAKERLAKTSRFLTEAQKAEYEQKMNLYEAGALELQKSIELEAQKKKEAQSSKDSFAMFNRGKIKEANSSFIKEREKLAKEIEDLQKKSEEAYAKGNKGGWGKKYANQAQQLEEQFVGISSMEQFNRIKQSSKMSAQQKIIGTSQLITPEADATEAQTAGYSDQALTKFLQKDLGMTEVTGLDKPIQVDTSIQNLEKVITKIQEVKTTGENIDQFAIELKNSLNQVNPTNIDNLKNSFVKLANQSGVSEQEIKEFTGMFDQLAKGEKLTEQQTTKLQTALEKMRQGTERTGFSLDELESEMLQTFAKSDMGEEQLQEMANKMKLSAEETEHLKLKLQRLKEESKNLKLAPNLTKGQAFGTLIGQAGQLAGSISMAVSAIQMLGAAFDENAEPAQRITSLLMGLSMLLPVLTTLTNTQNAAQIASSAATLFGAKVKAGATAAELGDAAAKSTNTVATWLLNTAQAALNGTTLSTLAIFGIFAAVILAVIAVIALAVVGIKAFIDSMHAEEIALENANKNLETQKELVQSLSDEYNNLKDTLNSLNEQQTAINTMIEGTREWEEAVAKVNEQVLELISKYPELSKYVTNTNGRLAISEEGQEELLNQQQKELDKAKSLQSYAQINKNEAQSAVNHKQAIVGFSIIHEYSDEQIKQIIDSGLDPTGALQGVNDVEMRYNGASEEDIYNAKKAAMEGETYATQTTIASVAQQLQSLYDSGNWSEYYNKLDELTGSNQNVIQQVHELVTSTNALNETNTLLRQQIIESEFEDNKIYKGSKNKEFLNEVLASDLEEKTNTIYEETYKDGSGMTDAVAQQQYAELMGWDPSLVENRNGNKAVYYDNEGKEVHLSDAYVRKYLAEQEAIKELNSEMEEKSEATDKLAEKEKQLAAKADGSVSSFRAYKEEMQKYGEELGFTEKEINSFINSHGNMQKEAKAATLSDNFQNRLQLTGASADEIAAGLSQSLNEEQMQIAVQLSAEANSLDEFGRELEAALHENVIKGLQSSSSEIESILSESSESGTFSAGQTQAILAQEEFQEFLKESGMSEVEFASENYSKKMAIVTQYYAELKGLESERLSDAKANYQEDLEEYQAILDYKQAMEEGDTASAEGIADAYDHIDFEAYLNMDISEVEDKMDEINASIDEINERQIKLDMEWDTTDIIEEGMKKVGDFANLMAKDAKKVGNSYQLTAAQAKEWMQVYPDLFQNAEVTTDGLISLSGDYVDTFIGDQEAATDAAIESNITQLESRISALEAEKEAAQADLELAKSMAEGKMELEGASTEYLVDTRQKLVDYYIDSGLDEVAANAAALDTMGLNEEEYSRIVSESTSRNAENQIEASEAGANGTVKVLLTLSERFKAFFNGIGEAWKKVLAGDFSGAWSSLVSGVSSGINGYIEVDEDVANNPYDSEGNFKEGFEHERTAVIKEIGAANVEDLTALIADIDGRIANIRSEINYNQALQNQDLSDYGSTDPDDDSGSNTIEELKEIAERYHEIEREIAALERTSERYNKQAARAWGPEKLKYMKWQLATLKETEKKQRDLLKAQAVFLVSDQAAVQSQFNNKAVFNANGDIANYTALLQQAADAYNAAVKTGDEEAIKAAEKVYDKQVEALEQYEQTLDAVEKQKDVIIELNTEMASMATEVIEYELEYKIEVSEFSISNLELQIGKLSDAIGDAAERFYLMGLSMDQSAKKAEAAEKSIVDILGTAGLTMDDILGASDAELETLLQDKHFSEEQIAALKNGFSEMANGTAEVQTKYAELGEAIVTEFQNANKEFDTLTQNMQHSSSIIDSYRNIIDLAGQHTLGISDDTLLKMSETQFKLAENSVKVAKEQLEMNKENLAVVEAQLKAAIALAEAEGRSVEDDRAVQMLQKTYDELFTVVQEKEQALLTAMENALEARQKLFKEELDQAMKTFEKSMSGQYGSFKGMQEAYNQQKALSKLFVADYEKIYSLSKLTRDIQNSIDDTDSIKGKERLLEIQEEINEAQKDGVQMTQYELDELRAKYDLRLAEIALEEAQNAKSVVRMQRNATGNWGYVYTADSDEVDAAMQAYEDKMYAYQKKMQDYTDQLQDQLIQIPQDYAAAIRAIYEDQTLSDEERRLRIKETQEYYSKMYSHVVNQLGIVNEDASRFYQEDWTNYAATSGYKISENQRWVDSFEETLVAKISGGFTTLAGLEQNFKQNSETLLGQTQDIYEKFQQGVNDVFAAAGKSVTDFVGDENTPGSLASELGEMGRYAEEAGKKAQAMGEAYTKAFQDAVDAISGKITEYGSWIKEWNAKTGEIGTALDALISKYQELQQAILDANSVPTPEVPVVPETPKTPAGNTNTGGGTNTSGNTNGTTNTSKSTNTDTKTQTKDTSKQSQYQTSVSTDKVKAMQVYLGVTADGLWGPKSSAAAQKYLGSAVDTAEEAESYFKFVQAYARPDQANRKQDSIGMKAVLASSLDHKSFKDLGVSTGRISAVNTGWITYFPQNSTLKKPSDTRYTFDTGGYTGEWDSSGRLAWLHQKELVLNASDTENFLAATNIIRGITKTIDLQALSQSYRMAALQPASMQQMPQIVEQDIVIHADFPSVHERREIEAAFDTLLNRASQFANRKK